MKPTDKQSLNRDDDRDNLATDIYDKCRRLYSDRRTRHLTIREITRCASATPAPGYYVTTNYAVRRLRHFRRRGYQGVTQRTERKWREIDRKVSRLQNSRRMDFGEAVEMAIFSPASSFFIEPSTALRVYHRQRRNHRDAAKQTVKKESR